jgi:hypothetical protein
MFQLQKLNLNLDKDDHQQAIKKKANKTNSMKINMKKEKIAQKDYGDYRLSYII